MSLLRKKCCCGGERYVKATKCPCEVGTAPDIYIPYGNVSGSFIVFQYNTKCYIAFRANEEPLPPGEFVVDAVDQFDSCNECCADGPPQCGNQACWEQGLQYQVSAPSFTLQFSDIDCPTCQMDAFSIPVPVFAPAVECKAEVLLFPPWNDYFPLGDCDGAAGCFGPILGPRSALRTVRIRWQPPNIAAQVQVIYVAHGYTYSATYVKSGLCPEGTYNLNIVETGAANPVATGFPSEVVVTAP